MTGVKRDIALLQRVAAQAGDSVTVLDISVAVNRPALAALLDRGVRVEYFDHHFAGELPVHSNLAAVIDPSSHVCTAMLADRHLGGRYRSWAAIAAFGDNLPDEARALAEELRLSEARTQDLRSLGETLSYNAYGDVEADLIVHPAVAVSDVASLCRSIRVHTVRVDLPDDQRMPANGSRTSTPRQTRRQAFRRDDLYPSGRRLEPARPRRVGQRAGPKLSRFAHAVLTRNAQGGYTVSVRAPISKGTGADALCRRFATGGGRVAAAGINHLPRSALPEFVREPDRVFPRA